MEQISLHETSVLVQNLSEFREQIKKLNKKAVNYHLPPIEILAENEVTYRVNHEYVGNCQDQLLTTLVPVKSGEVVDPADVRLLTRFDLRFPIIQKNGWRAIGKLERDDADAGPAFGYTLSSDQADISAVHQHLHDPFRCDHCRIDRHRKEVFIFRNDDGRYEMIGSHCAKDYTGIDPSAILFLAKMVSVVKLLEDNDMLSDVSMRNQCIATDDFLMNCLVLINQSASGFISVRKSRETGLPATYAQAIVPDFDWRKLIGNEQEADYRELLSSIYAWAEQQASMYENMETIPPEQISDAVYYSNISTAINASYIRRDNRKILAFLASIIPSYHRGHKEQQAASQFVGEVKEKLTLTVTVGNVLRFDGYYGASFLLIMKDPDGNILTWKTQSPPQSMFDYIGKSFRISCKVKEHQIYKEVRQTAVTHVKLIEN